MAAVVNGLQIRCTVFTSNNKKIDNNSQYDFVLFHGGVVLFVNFSLFKCNL